MAEPTLLCSAVISRFVTLADNQRFDAASAMGQTRSWGHVGSMSGLPESGQGRFTDDRATLPGAVTYYITKSDSSGTTHSGGSPRAARGRLSDALRQRAKWFVPAGAAAWERSSTILEGHR